MLLSVLLFNWVGYRLFTTLCEEREAGSLDASVENDEYDSSLLVMMRIPADALPYSNASREFQPATGFIQIGSLRYRELKKRIYNDSVEFLCLLDGAASRLRSAGNDYFSLVNDLQKRGHSSLPGPAGKTGHRFAKVIYYSAHRFPDLRFIAARSASPTRFLLPRLAAGHPRITLQPPWPVVGFS
ncbi:MAG TPA: hypothetical protein VGR89_02970 [Puia sp.]|nr:hypothetical protein [Puia sp.]